MSLASIGNCKKCCEGYFQSGNSTGYCSSFCEAMDSSTRELEEKVEELEEKVDNLEKINLEFMERIGTLEEKIKKMENEFNDNSDCGTMLHTP